MITPVAEVIAVGIPARDEEHRITACIEAVAAAARRIDQPVCLVVAADRCTDSTIAAAEQALSSSRGLAASAVLAIDGGTVGSTRHVACVAAIELARIRRATPLITGIWLATTDADSRVPPDWFEAHMRHRAAGARGVAGLVALDPSETTELLDLTYRASIDALDQGEGHPHVHGANLALCADLFTRAGGFPPLTVGEDQALWHTIHGMGEHLHAASDLYVTTSSRFDGRTAGGFAGYLRALAHDGGA